VERLYVLACYADQGTSMKRVRPAPMGRAFRVVKRTAHLTVQLAERPLKIAPVSGEAAGGERPARARKTAGGGAGTRRKTARTTAAAKA
jgi:large subunit ribosomal protein L22